MSAKALAGSAGSSVAPTPGSGGMVCQEAQAVLRLTTGKRRVPIESLGPALFNRFAQPLSGKHVLALAQKILKTWGFATYKYEAGWCHEAPARARLRLGWGSHVAKGAPPSRLESPRPPVPRPPFRPPCPGQSA